MTAATLTTDTLTGQTSPETHPARARQGQSPEPTILVSTPTITSSARGTTSGSGHRDHDTHMSHAAAGSDSPTGHDLYDTQTPPARGGTNSETGQSASECTTPIERTLADPSLAFAADILDDLEAVRKANNNRLGTLTRTEPDADGEMRGWGLDENDPDVARLAALVKMLEDAEHQATLNLQRAMRKHPLGAWVKAQKGVGEKQAARLLAAVGDPYVNMQTGEIRTVGQLWAYCGHGAPLRKQKGMTQADLFAMGSPIAKMRLWNIATACLKAQGHYADVYYARKEATVGREHATECVRCGPSGKPAQPGSPWSDAHRHADALRIVGKHILRDLWLEAKRIHEGGDA